MNIEKICKSIVLNVLHLMKQSKRIVSVIYASSGTHYKTPPSEAIVSVEEHDDNAVIIDRIKARLDLGLGIYGHGVQVESSE